MSSIWFFNFSQHINTIHVNTLNTINSITTKLNPLIQSCIKQHYKERITIDQFIQLFEQESVI